MFVTVPCILPPNSGLPISWWKVASKCDKFSTTSSSANVYSVRKRIKNATNNLYTVQWYIPFSTKYPNHLKKKTDAILISLKCNNKEHCVTVNLRCRKFKETEVVIVGSFHPNKSSISNHLEYFNDVMGEYSKTHQKSIDFGQL